MIIKFFVTILIIALIFTLAIFSGVLQLLPETTENLREIISYTPIEMRASIGLIFLGLLILIGKSFYN